MAPTHYDIRLELDLETFTFTGSVGIDLDVIEPTDTLVLNANEVEIKSAALSDGTEITGIAYDADMERATLSLGATLKPGQVRLEIEHAGIINDQLCGLYRSVYRDVQGNEHPLAASQ